MMPGSRDSMGLSGGDGGANAPPAFCCSSSPGRRGFSPANKVRRRSPTSSVVVVLAAIGLASAFTSTAAPAVSAQPGPALSIVSPAEDTVATGVLSIDVAIVPDPRAATVEVFVDGRELCTIARAPWSCKWDAGRDVREHHVRVVATLEGGRRLVANRRTRGLTIAERIDVSAVQVPVLVTGPDGRFVRGLTTSSFQLTENGKPQRLDTLIDESVPLDLVLAVDISSSMQDSMPAVQEALKRLLTRLRPGDMTTLLGFNDTMFVLAERETDPDLRAAAVEGLVPWGGTAMYDATIKGVEMVSSQAGRRGVIVFSDGDDRHSASTRQSAQARIEEAQVVVYTIGFGRGTSAQFRVTLEAFAESSGGRAFFPRGTDDLDEAFTRILDELSHQYVLSYVSDAAKPGAWPRLEVRATCQGCRVRAREGYRAPER
jgi:VWFA-related protein